MWNAKELLTHLKHMLALVEIKRELQQQPDSRAQAKKLLLVKEQMKLAEIIMRMFAAKNFLELAPLNAAYCAQSARIDGIATTPTKLFTLDGRIDKRRQKRFMFHGKRFLIVRGG